MRIEAYRVIITPLTAEDGGGFWAEVPELPGCFSDGETQHDALTNVHDAIGCWIEAMEEMGAPIPEPQHGDRMRAAA